VDGIVYLSAIGTRTINVPNLFADLCQLLPAEIGAKLDALYRDPKISTHDKMLALFERFPSGRIVVLLDNFESVIDATACCVKDAELDDTLCALLSAPHHAVKIILTTRVPPRELELFQPGSQAYLPVDAGLESSYAKQLLREMDVDSRVGLKNADDAILQRACDRTRGFPRALEALYAILAADRYTALEEILGVGASDVRAFHETPLPENVVEALVGEAFSRLDPTAQKVMQALAAYARPVTPAAVDYLLQPFIASVDSAPVLNRLVSMQFAHRESGKYYLHPTDRDYAMGRVPRSDLRGLGDLEGLGAWTQRALLNRAADYFAQAPTPRETWKTLADLDPQLNEFDLRCAAEDYDTAASVLLEIDGEYLLLWGHYRLMAEMHERLQGKIGDLFLKLRSLNNRGLSADSTGQVQKAIDCYEEALPVARELKNRKPKAQYSATLATRTPTWGRRNAPSSFTSKPSPSPAKLATNAAKATASAIATRTWGRRNAPSSSTSKH
jgi:tetratricopeptide (TPR) repeat protein